MNRAQSARFSGSPACSLAVSTRAASSTDRLAGLDPILGETIEPGELGDGIGFEPGFVAGVLPAPEDHAELRAPVAQVVVANDPVARAPR